MALIVKEKEQISFLYRRSDPLDFRAALINIFILTMKIMTKLNMKGSTNSGEPTETLQLSLALQGVLAPLS